MEKRARNGYQRHHPRHYSAKDQKESIPILDAENDLFARG
jgi:hypothetical protein